MSIQQHKGMFTLLVSIIQSQEIVICFQHLVKCAKRESKNNTFLIYIFFCNLL